MAMLDDMLNKYKNKFFVETGLGKGHGLTLALKHEFEHVYSIEISEKIFNKYGSRIMRKYPKKVSIFCGKSEDILWPIIENIHSSITFWLDAHLKPDVNIEPPLVKELEIISRHPIKNHIILIDDIRQMGQGVYPHIYLIIKKIMEINPKYKISYEDGCGKGQIFKSDILVACVGEDNV